MSLSLCLPPTAVGRRFAAICLSLMLSGWGSVNGFLPRASALGIDAGTLGATGGMLDCADSGVLVAFAGSQKELGKCALKHTDVKATVSGYVSRVTVRQQFHNPYKEKIEAVYTFPLPENAAVDEMTMKVGDRVIRGNIKKKAEARQTYETARAQGHVASLLDQERPNIFTQSVANIEPGENIDIEIKYVSLLKYEDGSFSFNFPTVVGPRFIPGHVNEGKSGTGVVQDTDMVPDASKITPPTVSPGERAGHDIAIDLDIDAAVPIRSVRSLLHDVDLQQATPTHAHLKLKAKDRIPNKDFVAKWEVAADKVQSGYLTHRNGNEGFFTLMLVPPKRVSAETVQPKEMIFLIDCSGSQSGRPIQKAKETMDYILRHMNPNDTFQIITFNSGHSEFPARPEINSQSLRDRALSYINGIQARGGTWMAPAVEQALNLPNPEHRLRIVTFMTDGYVGNDMQILSMIKKYRGDSRWFSFGTGNSVNRFLIDNIAKEGGGEAEYVLLNSSAEEVGKKFYERISSPVLTDIKVEFQGVEVKEVFPKEPADLWAQRPLYFSGRYSKAGSGNVILSGYAGGKPYRQVLKIELPELKNENDVLPSIWARAKVDRLMSEDWMGAQMGNPNAEIKEEIESTALKYHIMSQYTSFVAVEEDRKTQGGKPKQVVVPVEMPEGVELEASRGQGWSNGPVVFGPGGSGGGGGGAGGVGWSVPPHSGYTTIGGAPVSTRSVSLPQANMGKYVHSAGDALRSGSSSAVRGSLVPAGRSNHYIDAAPSISDYRSFAETGSAPPPPPVLSYPSYNQSFSAPAPVRARVSKPSIAGKAEEQKSSHDKNKQASAGHSAKLDKRVLELIQAAEGKKVQKAEVLKLRVELSEKPGSDLLARLNACGLKISKRDGMVVFGKIELSRISELEKLAEVLHIMLDGAGSK